MQPYLESLLNYIDGAPPWTPTNRGHGITSRSTEAPPWGSPRGSWNYALTNEAPPRNYCRITSYPNQHHVSIDQHRIIYHTNIMPVTSRSDITDLNNKIKK